MNTQSVLRWVVVGFVVYVLYKVVEGHLRIRAAARRQRPDDGQRPIAQPLAAPPTMRRVGTFVTVLGTCALLWACMAELAIDPAAGLASNLQWAATRNNSMLWGFGLLVVGLLMRVTNPMQRTDPDAPTDRTHRRCPACAEPVLREATKCKHCGESFTPLPYSR